MTAGPIVRRALAVCLLAAGVAGCGDSGSKTTVTVPPTTVVPFEDQFGTQFGIDFRASANTDPVQPVDGNIIPLTLTADPVAIPTN